MENNIIVKTQVREREINNSLITNTKDAWLNELSEAKKESKKKDIEALNIIEECKTFVERSIDGDAFFESTEQWSIHFDLVNKSGHIYGQMVVDNGSPYDCLIEPVV